MSTLTQRIPTLLLGISQQPDNLKFPGQVVDANNVFPDYALGMLKRPGGKFVASLKDAVTSGKWFPILRDEDEKYVAQYDGSTFRVWSLIDGSPRAVDMGTNTGVPGTCVFADLRDELNDFNAAVDVTEAELEDLNEFGAAYAEVSDGQTGVVTTLFNVTTNYDTNYEQTLVSGVLYDGIRYRLLNNSTVIKEYSTSTFTFTGTYTRSGSTVTVTSTDHGFSTGHYIKFDFTSGDAFDGIFRITVTDDDTFTFTHLESGTTSGNVTITDIYSLGTERTDDYPYLKRTGVKLYELVSTAASANTTSDLSTADSNLTTALADYNQAVTDQDAAEVLYNAERDDCVIATVPPNAYLSGATADDLEILTINDYTFILNKAKVTAMKTATSAALPNQAFVVISIVAYHAEYIVNINGTNYTYQTPKDTSSGNVDTGIIVSNLVSTINAATGTHGVTASAAGPGIYLSGTSAFEVSTSGSGAEEGIYVFQNEINVSGRLPNQCRDGYVVKVYNSDIVDADDMWVEFQTQDGATSGPGVWVETVAPEIEFELDELTMPHQLIRNADGTFTYGPIDWTDRLVGDDTTNPIPSFIGQTLNNLFFYRNRLGFLSNENITFSKAGDYFNFFAGSAQLVSADDPIDITATSQTPVNLAYVQTVAVGLVLFGQNEQFLISTDADVLSPTTAKINTLSKYECDEKLDAVSLGTSLAFVSKTQLWSRVYELSNIQKEAPADSNELSNNVAELIPATIDSFISSPALGIVSFGQTGTDTLYQYRFYQVGNERLANTWYKWQLTGNLLSQFFDETTFYAVAYDGSNVFVQSYDLTQASEQGFLTLPTGEKTDVCMDMFTVNPRRTYDSTTKRTRIWFPYNTITGQDDNVCVVVLGGYIGQTVSATESIGAVLTGDSVTVDSLSGDFYAEIDGDYRGRNLILGYLYDMTIQLPQLFVGQSESKTQYTTDSTADLIIHRLKVNTGLSGPVTYSIDITGRSDWQNVVNVTLPYDYTLGNVNLSASSEHVVPVFQRNKNLKITIKGDTAFPVSINSLTWEGNYNTRFYRRS